MSTQCKEYNFLEIEPYWQSFWEENQSFRAEQVSSKPKYYVLDMFPYPSGTGLHIGHPEGYTATDIIARYKRAKGFNVLHPIGWDAFGLPAEQHAVKTGTHPATNTQNNITNFKRQIKALGFSYDWQREIDTTDPKYFRWTQWIFLQLFQRGLAYVDERPVWWCPELRTVLANEEVVDGKSEVGGFPVERKNLRQWVLRITAYAERLLADLKEVDWPDSTKRMQEAWIGRSEGAEILFKLERESLGTLKIFTTRPDTLFGCTYMVLSPEHPLVDALTTPEQKPAVAEYRKKSAGKSDLERTDLDKDKSGVFSGAYAINPINGARVPVWIADYVLMGYGTGAIMAVPAHDERDYEFAVKYSLPTPCVIAAPEGDEKLPYTGDGVLVNSPGYDGLPWADAKKKITADLAARGVASATVNYKLRDWLFSRQRYWGEPFPVAWVSESDYRRAEKARASSLPANPVTYISGGTTHYALPLPAGALPLALPDVQSYLPSGNGESPLANVSEWLELWLNYETGASIPASQPRPAGDVWIRARRETNTMPQWAGSCWYYLRFTDPKNDQAFASPEALRYWGVPDLYVGGAEHAVLHLLYARFWHKVLFDLGHVSTPEPFYKLVNQGLILGEDMQKMSKSRGNVVNPDDVLVEYGADAFRLYEMFMGPLQDTKPWNTKGVEGVYRFLGRVWRLFVDEKAETAFEQAETTATTPEQHAELLDLILLDGAIIDMVATPAQLKTLHACIKKVTEDLDGMRFNTAISAMMVFINEAMTWQTRPLSVMKTFLQLLAPFAPHIAEELWARLHSTFGLQATSLAYAPWPKHDPALLVESEIEIPVQVNGKFRDTIKVAVDADNATIEAAAKASEKVQVFTAGKTIKKVIIVPKRMVNLIVG